jgi:hypothetical protein
MIKQIVHGCGSDYTSAEENLLHASLKLGDAKDSEQLRQIREAALHAIEAIAKALEGGTCDPWALNVITSFLHRVAADKDSDLAVKIFALQPGKGGRPKTAEELRSQASWAYSTALGHGYSPEEAIQAAYEFRLGVGSFKRDSERKVTSGGVLTNRAEVFIKDTLKGELRTAGVLQRKQPGRKSKNPP